MKCYMEWKVCVYCFVQAHCTLRQSMDLVFLFYSLKSLYHKRRCINKTSVLTYISAALCLCISQILQVGNSGVCLCIDHVHTGYWAFSGKNRGRQICHHSRIKLKRRWSKSQQHKERRHRILCGSGGAGEGETSAHSGETVNRW